MTLRPLVDIRAVCGELVMQGCSCRDIAVRRAIQIVVWGHVVPQPLLTIVGVSARVRITLV